MMDTTTIDIHVHDNNCQKFTLADEKHFPSLIGRKTSGSEFCNARKASQMIKSLTELREKVDVCRQSSIDRMESQLFGEQQRYHIDNKKLSFADIMNRNMSNIVNDGSEEGFVTEDELIGRRIHSVKHNVVHRHPLVLSEEVGVQQHRVERNKEITLLQYSITIAGQHENLVELIIILPLVLMSLYILLVEKGDLFRVVDV